METVMLEEAGGREGMLLMAPMGAQQQAFSLG